MRSRTFLLAAAAVASAVICTTAFSAHADEEPPPGTATIDQVTPIVIDKQHPLIAFASFRYTCDGTVETDHLFVAAKQGPFINSTTRTSSDWARAFYSTNWRSDQSPNALTCDGQAHRILVKMLPDPAFSAHHGVNELRSGHRAYLQICVFDSTGLAMNDSMQKVFVSR